MIAQVKGNLRQDQVAAEVEISGWRWRMSQLLIEWIQGVPRPLPLQLLQFH